MTAFHPDQPRENPRPIFETLGNAVGAAIRCGNSFDHINAERWARTYHCDPSDVEAAWIKALTKETNANPMEGK